MDLVAKTYLPYFPVAEPTLSWKGVGFSLLHEGGAGPPGSTSGYYASRSGVYGMVKLSFYHYWMNILLLAMEEETLKLTTNFHPD